MGAGAAVAGEVAVDAAAADVAAATAVDIGAEIGGAGLAASGAADFAALPAAADLGAVSTSALDAGLAAGGGLGAATFGPGVTTPTGAAPIGGGAATAPAAGGLTQATPVAAPSLGATPGGGGAAVGGLSGPAGAPSVAPDFTQTAIGDITAGQGGLPNFAAATQPPAGGLGGVSTASALAPESPLVPPSAFPDLMTPGAPLATGGGGGGFLAGLKEAAPLIGAGTSIAGLGAQALGLTGKLPGTDINKQAPQAQALTTQAQNLGTQSANLLAPLTTGTLPPGLQSGIDRATQSAKAAVRNNFANLGLAGSTMETEALNNIDAQAQTQAVNTAIGLFNQGLDEARISNSIYQQLLTSQLGLNRDFSNSIANFAAALAGGGTRRPEFVG